MLTVGARSRRRSFRRLRFSDVKTGDAPDPDMWDVIRVSSDDAEPVVLGEGGPVPISELGDADDRNHDVDDSSGPFGDI